MLQEAATAEVAQPFEEKPLGTEAEALRIAEAYSVTTRVRRNGSLIVAILTGSKNISVVNSKR